MVAARELGHERTPDQSCCTGDDDGLGAFHGGPHQPNLLTSGAPSWTGPS